MHGVCSEKEGVIKNAENFAWADENLHLRDIQDPSVTSQFKDRFYGGWVYGEGSNVEGGWIQNVG